MKKLIAISLYLAFSLISYGQCETYEDAMISKICSIVKAENITKCEVYAHNKEAYSDIQNKGEFKIDGPFIVINNVYYNISKLLHFSVVYRKERTIKEQKKDEVILSFVFQYF